MRRRDRVPPPVAARPAPAAPAQHSDQENRRRRRLSTACPACSPRAPALVRWAERFPCIRTNELDNSLATHFIKISDEQRLTKGPHARQSLRLPRAHMAALEIRRA